MRNLYSLLGKLNIPKHELPNLYDTIRSHELAYDVQLNFREVISFCELYLEKSPGLIFLSSKV